MKKKWFLHWFRIELKYLNAFFEEISREILSGFFEDRPEELADGLLKTWSSDKLEINELNEEYFAKKDKERTQKLKVILQRRMIEVNFSQKLNLVYK